MAHPRRPRPGHHPARMLALVMAFAALLAGCGLDDRPPVTPSGPASAQAPAGLRLQTVATLPEVHVPGQLQVVAGTGSRFIIVGDGGRGRYSPDNGRTWTDLPDDVSVRAGLQADGGPSFGTHLGYQGMFAGLVPAQQGDAYLGVQRWNPETGAVTFIPYPLVADPATSSGALYPVDFVGSAIVLSDNRILRITDDQAVALKPAFAATPRLQGLQTALTKDAATAVQAGYSLTGNYGYLNLAPADGSAGGRAIRIPGLLAMDVSAFTVHYLVGTADELSVCKAVVTRPTKPSCITLAVGDYRRSRYQAHLTTSIGADQVYLARRAGGGVRQWLVRERRVSLVAKGDSAWQWLPFRDSDLPMALVTSSTGVPTAATVNRDGRPTPLFAAPATVAPVTALAVSPGRISYQQDHYAARTGTVGAVWARPITDVLGAEQRLIGHPVTALQASGGRTAAQLDGSGGGDRFSLAFYDGRARSGTAKGTTSNWLRDLSGPYALVGRQVLRVDGHRLHTGPVLALFGSRIVEAHGVKASDRTFQLRDLERPDAEPVPLNLPRPPGRSYDDDGWWLCADWLVARYSEGTAVRQLALNLRTGAVVEFGAADQVLAVGDGWAVITGGASVRLQVLDSAATLPVEDSTLAALATDGVRTLAWSDPGGTHVAEVDGLPLTPHRLLGALHADTAKVGTVWAPQFDLTGAVAAGALEIRDSAGNLIRTLTTPAGGQGAIRGVRWDGNDESGKRVTPGTYSWTLMVDGSDGSGRAVSVDGSGPPSGSLVVGR